MKSYFDKDHFISKESMFAFQEGYYAFSRGWIASKYNLDGLKGKEWQRGFNCAYFDNIYRIQQNKPR